MNSLGERNERPFLTLSQAAKRVGKSKAIADGRLSVANRDTTVLSDSALSLILTTSTTKILPGLPIGSVDLLKENDELGDRVAVLQDKVYALEMELAAMKKKSWWQRLWGE